MANGPDLVLRIHRPGYHSRAELELELLWTRALSDAGIAVPIGRRKLRRAGYGKIPTPDGKSSRHVGVADWIEGPILQEEIEQESDPSRIASRFNQIGRFAARIHNQSNKWVPPAKFTRHAFDVPGYFGKSSFWGRLWDLPPLEPVQREFLSRARHRIAKILGSYGHGAGVYSMIHADLHPKELPGRGCRSTPRDRF